MAKTVKKKARRGKKKKTPGLLSRWMTETGRFAARHPSWLAGPVVFGVVFSFVSANALWYQPGPHPGPMMKTRSPVDPYLVPGQHAISSEEAYETFRIERDEDVVTGSVETQEGAHRGGEADLMAILKSVQDNPPRPEPAVQPASDVEAQDATLEDALPDKTAILISVQKRLSDLGYYTGEADGVTGPLTRTAIVKFQADHNLAETGTADQGLLTVLNSVASQGSPPLPSPRPPAEVSTGTGDAVTAVLQTASASQSAETAGVASPMVVEIQRGLVNIAYDDVTVDGVAGTKTREAILQFQKHYRLPATGEPSVAVLDKLKEIGAL